MLKKENTYKSFKNDIANTGIIINIEIKISYLDFTHRVFIFPGAGNKPVFALLIFPSSTLIDSVTLLIFPFMICEITR